MCSIVSHHLMTESSTMTTMMTTTMIKTDVACTALGVAEAGTKAWRGSEAATWTPATTHVIVTMTGGNVAGAQRETSARTASTGEMAAEAALWIESTAQIAAIRASMRLTVTTAQTEGTAATAH